MSLDGRESLARQASGYWQYQEEDNPQEENIDDNHADHQDPSQEVSDVNFVQAPKLTDHHCHKRNAIPFQKQGFPAPEERVLAEATGRRRWKQQCDNFPRCRKRKQKHQKCFDFKLCLANHQIQGVTEQIQATQIWLPWLEVYNYQGLVVGHEVPMHL